MAPTSSRFPAAATALVVVDMINPLDFPGGARFAVRVRRIAAAIARLAERARAARIPVIFVNDNMGRWRSDIEALIDQVQKSGAPGAPLIDILRPQPDDFVVLKSTLSGFHQTPLDAMLRLGKVRTVIVTGVLTGNCVLFTAADAYMRDLSVVVPSDCVADLTPTEHRLALAKMKRILKARVQPAARVAMRRTRRARTA